MIVLKTVRNYTREDICLMAQFFSSTRDRLEANDFVARSQFLNPNLMSVLMFTMDLIRSR